jgi:MFS family permease
LVSAPLSGRRVATYGPRPSLLIAGVGMCTGAAMLTVLTAHTSLVWLFTSYVVFAIGFGAVNAPITNTAVSAMPVSQAGTAAAIASTSRQVGIALGVAIIGSVINRGGADEPFRAQLTAANHLAWTLIASFGLLVLILAGVTTTAWARRTATRTAKELIEHPATSSPPVVV